VQAFSDRDVAAFEAPFGIRDLGKKKANQRLLETVEAFEPDIIITCHADIISNSTLDRIKLSRPKIILVDCNNDPLFVPENVKKIRQRASSVDHVFVSTGSSDLKKIDSGKAELHHMPNPVDSSIETFDSSTQKQLPYDLIFCSNSINYTKRGELVSYVKENIEPAISFYTPGNYGEKNIWGRDYDDALSKSKMGLNLNRQEGYDWYSSARMAQLVGNGLLTFVSSSGRFDQLFPMESIAYFTDEDDLTRLITEFYHDDDKRCQWAKTARQFMHKEINSTLYAQYIVETSMGIKYTHDYVWLEDSHV